MLIPTSWRGTRSTNIQLLLVLQTSSCCQFYKHPVELTCLLQSLFAHCLQRFDTNTMVVQGTFHSNTEFTSVDELGEFDTCVCGLRYHFGRESTFFVCLKRLRSLLRLCRCTESRLLICTSVDELQVVHMHHMQILFHQIASEIGLTMYNQRDDMP